MTPAGTTAAMHPANRLSNAFNPKTHPRPTAPPRRLYAKPSPIVKKRLLGLAPVWMSLSAGCAVSPGPAGESFIVGIRYDVEPRRIAVSDDALPDKARGDFVSMAALGFDTVILQHVTDADRLPLLDLAAECGLKLMLPDRDIDHFIKTGMGPGAGPMQSKEFLDQVQVVASHPAFAGVILPAVVGIAAQKRTQSVRQALAERHISVLCLSAGGPSAPAIIQSAPVWDGASSEASARLLAQYFAALRAGRTGGIVVDRFARLPGDPPGLHDPTNEVLAGHRAAVDALLSRARRWGPLLAGAQALELSPPDGSTDLTLTMLRRGSRTYLLIAATDPHRFVRREVRLPVSWQGQTLSRAVEIPPTAQEGAGDVFLGRGREVIVSLSLRPGDAALFEMF